MPCKAATLLQQHYKADPLFVFLLDEETKTKHKTSNRYLQGCGPSYAI
jgi:hypothetical protein